MNKYVTEDNTSITAQTPLVHTVNELAWGNPTPQITQTNYKKPEE